MNWLFDHANFIYILLGIVALGFVTAWWLNKRVKYLAYAGVAVALIALFCLLGQFVVTDREQIQRNVQQMADAVVRGGDQELFKHCSRDFRYKEMTREQLAALVKGIAAQHKITEVKIWEFEFENIARADHSANAHFKASVFDKDSVLGIVFCIASFTLENEKWLLRTIEFRDARHPDQPMPGAP